MHVFDYCLYLEMSELHFNVKKERISFNVSVAKTAETVLSMEVNKISLTWLVHLVSVSMRMNLTKL